MALLSDAFAISRVEPIPLSSLIQDMLHSLYAGGMAVLVCKPPLSSNVMLVYQNARWVEQSNGKQVFYFTQFDVVQRLLMLLRDTGVLSQVRLYGARHTLQFPHSIASNCAAPGARVYPMSHIAIDR